ncbi:LuxR C-terminal-related transcriptional regulator [Microbacterium sp. 2FI]|uniref:helix-turn-helix transcriptional regulator n=1 Tax=Microbacterium sp. 2FI TaxID=2502193 RepID=UPI0010F85B4D|nr:LuxR C-terminal-related transcriptional regulator [Microbacterium sp. 2FI]
MAASGARRIPGHAIDRPALRSQLDAGIEGPLVLVVAPAGSGKSVLLSQWVRSRSDLRFAWLDITPADVDVSLFSQRLTAAIADAAPGAPVPSAPVANAEGGLGEAYLEELAYGLADAGEIVLVFDDLDRIAGSPVLPDLWRLVDLLPPNAHAVFASRMDLQLGWSRHRLEHALVEIRQRELAFDDDETARVLVRIMKRPVAESTATAVTARTEGWAVGVQLAALRLRFADDPAAVVDGFAGTDRLVVDYLSEEVLDAQSASRRTSLTRLSVLEELCAGLVEAVAGEADGAGFLEALEHDSMFVIADPVRPGWFRFHHLFRDLLRYRLRAEDSLAEGRLLTAAADWHLAQGDRAAAIDALLRARRWGAALDLVLVAGRDVYEDVRTSTVARWLAQVPAEVRAQRTDVVLLTALVEGMNGRGAYAADTFREVIASDGATVGERQVARAYLAVCVQFQPHPELYLEAARLSLEDLAAHSDAELPDLMGLTSRSLLVTVSTAALGRAHFFLGELDAARAAVEAALATPGIAYTPYRVHALGSLALAEAFDGALNAAAAHADEALAIARDFDLLSHPAPADAYLARAVVAIQRGEPDDGALALAEGGLRAAANGRTQLMWIARLAAKLIDPLALDAAADEPAGPPPPLVRASMMAIELRRERLRGVFVAAPMHPRPPDWSPLAFEEVAAFLAAGQPSAARERMPRAVAPERATRSVLPAIKQEVLEAWTLALEGRVTEARALLDDALRRAEPEWLVHPFVRAGPDVADLIDKLPGNPTAFRRFVVKRTRAASGNGRDRLVEELTPRELEILAYLPTRLTISDIAARCFVSTNTVKTHVGHIYRKLDVPGRDAAITRAVELGLLDAHEIARVG